MSGHPRSSPITAIHVTQAIVMFAGRAVSWMMDTGTAIDLRTADRENAWDRVLKVEQ